MRSAWATQILPDYCQSEKLCQNKRPSLKTASLNLWKACTTVNTWAKWVSPVEFRSTFSPSGLMKLGNVSRWCDGESWRELLPNHRRHNQQPIRLLQVRATCETKLAQIRAPSTHLRLEERTPALRVLHLLLIHFVCPPPAPAHRLAPLAASSWEGCLNLWNMALQIRSYSSVKKKKKKAHSQRLYLFLKACLWKKTLPRWQSSTLWFVTNLWQKVDNRLKPTWSDRVVMRTE